MFQLAFGLLSRWSLEMFQVDDSFQQGISGHGELLSEGNYYGPSSSWGQRHRLDVNVNSELSVRSCIGGYR